jgi:hypothetical protein
MLFFLSLNLKEKKELENPLTSTGPFSIEFFQLIFLSKKLE